MRKNNCEVIRRELDELMLDETCSAAALDHLKDCVSCREFQQTQTKLRRMVGSLGTVSAPADFDFRLRARLANDPGAGVFHYWPSFAWRGLAVAAMLILFAFGVVVVRNVVNQQERNQVVAEQQPPVRQESPKPVQSTESKTSDAPKEFVTQIPASNPQKIRSERPAQTGSRTRRLTSVEFSSQGAEVLSGTDPLGSGTIAVFPIDTSLQSLKLSLDDGRGNAKTISVPTIRFGSQRMLPTSNQFAAKNIW
jgi:hypothetical protein